MERNIPIGVEFTVLNQAKRDKIHEASLQLLEEVGIKVTGQKMLDILEAGGAILGKKKNVKLPRAMVEKALKTVPSEVKIFNRDGKQIGSMGEERNIYFGSIAEQMEYLDYKTNETRRFQREDIKMMCTLQDYLPNVDFTCSVGIAEGTHPAVAGQIGFIDVVRNYTKGIHVVTSETQALKDIVEMSQAMLGGKEALMETPIFIYYAEPIPPLTHPWESCERLIVCAENGIPLTYMPYCMMGGTAPIESASALVQCNADVLVGLVMSQLVREGAPYIYGAMPTMLDMVSTIGSYGAPEFHLNIAAASEMAEYYHIPFYGTSTVSDARTIDPQSMSEIQMSIFSSMLSKATIVHDMGLLDHAMNISPAAIYIANEIVGQMAAYVKGVDISDDTILLDDFKEVGPGGHFLETDATLERCRNKWYPTLFRRETVNPEQSDVMERVIAGIDHILETHVPTPLAPEKEAILAEYEAKFLKEHPFTR